MQLFPLYVARGFFRYFVISLIIVLSRSLFLSCVFVWLSLFITFCLDVCSSFVRYFLVYFVRSLVLYGCYLYMSLCVFFLYVFSFFSRDFLHFVISLRSNYVLSFVMSFFRYVFMSALFICLGMSLFVQFVRSSVFSCFVISFSLSVFIQFVIYFCVDQLFSSFVLYFVMYVFIFLIYVFMYLFVKSVISFFRYVCLALILALLLQFGSLCRSFFLQLFSQVCVYFVIYLCMLLFRYFFMFVSSLHHPPWLLFFPSTLFISLFRDCFLYLVNSLFLSHVMGFFNYFVIYFISPLCVSSFRHFVSSSFLYLF